jgi:adenylate cyclase
VSLTLQRFDDLTLRDETRKLEASLRRYVPGAVADVIDHGEELEPKNEEVSVLFVDLRNYTSLSEAHEAEEIFSSVNRYTELVSQLVRDEGGVVVEFNGDGMMAVFGAPAPLPDKEAAAVRAALAITRTVGDLPAPGGEVGAMRTGVGIATGPVFVGNIRAADRLIWSAIGNTTNLAARLEGLTRDLDVDVVIDATTWDRAGNEAVDFDARLRIPIRGRTTLHDLYVKSMARG